MSKYTKFNYKRMSRELYEQSRMPIPIWISNVKCCMTCKNYDGVVGHCHKLSELTGYIENTIWFMACEYYNGHSMIDNAYGWYEVCEKCEAHKEEE